MNEEERRQALETLLGARLRKTGAVTSQMDFLDRNGDVRNTRPASAMEARMWALLVRMFSTAPVLPTLKKAHHE